MSESVADVLWSMLVSAGVKRCYGIVGDALNPVIDALRRDGRVEFIQVRNEEAGVLAAVAEASLTGNLVAVCGTAGPGVMHLLNGLMDAQREGVPVIAIAGDTVSGLIDSGTIEEINPYTTFQLASLYTGRLINPAQTRPCSSLPSSAAKHAAESVRGTQNQSTDPLRPTSAVVRRSPINA
jgi:pyruvate dehydrogenase (quinone)